MTGGAAMYGDLVIRWLAKEYVGSDHLWTYFRELGFEHEQAGDMRVEMQCAPRQARRICCVRCAALYLALDHLPLVL